MKKKRVVILVLLMVLMVGIISAKAGSSSGVMASLPWVTQKFKDGESGVRNLSAEFVGKYQIPMTSMSRIGNDRIYQAHKATSAVEGNCGPDNAWFCTSWYDSALVPGTVSQMATQSNTDTHVIKWAYSTGAYIRGATIELMDDMSFVDDDYEDLIQINKFGSTLVGTPSLQTVGGHYAMAVIIQSTDLYIHKLVYMHYTGNDMKYSCIDSGSVYECEVIEQSYGANSMGAPSLQISDDGSVGISYYKASAGVRYAYPHVPTFLYPSNCGPGGNTWRCITIFLGSGVGEFYPTVKLATGKTRAESGIAFIHDDVLIPDTLYHAEYVGTGGNCGADRNQTGLTVNKWQCEDIVGLGDLAVWYEPSFSIDIDPEGYSVIAFEYAPEEQAPIALYLTYPNARLGIDDGKWALQRIDYAPTTTVATGSQAALALDGEGRGFIGYLQLEEYQLPDVKFAWQPHMLFLPHTKR